MTAAETLRKLAQEAGLDATESAAILKALDNQSFQAKLGTEFVPRAEYSRSMDALSAERTKFDADKAAWVTWYNSAKLTEQQNAAAIDYYNKTFVDRRPADPAAPAFDAKNYVSKADFDKAMADAVNRAVQTNVSITKDALRAQAHYAKTFGKDLDLDALEAAALKAGKPLADAYRDFISADLEAKTKADNEAALAKARAEGAQEALSKHNLPVDGAKTEGHVLFDALERDKATQPLSERQRAQGFAEEWLKQAHAA